MKQSIVHIALVVRDYDEAIEFYTRKLRFTLVEDTYQPEQNKRWVVGLLRDQPGLRCYWRERQRLSKRNSLGIRRAGAVFLFLETDDFWRDYNEMKLLGIKLEREPKEETYGTVAVFKDLYGNLWDLIERRGS